MSDPNESVPAQSLKPLFVYVSDTHMQPGAWVSRPDIVGDAYQSFDQVCQLAAKYAVPLVIGGDIFDSDKPDAESVRRFCRSIEEAGIAVWYVLGDHDVGQHWAALAKNTRPLDGVCLKFGDAVTVTGVNFSSRDTLKARLASLPPDANMLVCHQAWTDLRGIGNTVGYVQELVPGHVRYVLAGDTHVNSLTPTRNAAGGECVLVSAGSTCMQDMQEPPGKFCVLVGELAGRAAFVNKPLVTRHATRHRITEAAGLAEFATHDWAGYAAQERRRQASCPTYLEPLVHVIYDSRVPGALAAIEAATAGHVKLFPVALADTGGLAVAVGEADLVGKATAVDELVTVARLALPGNPQMLGHAERLLSVQDRSHVLGTVLEVIKDFQTKWTAGEAQIETHPFAAG